MNLLQVSNLTFNPGLKVLLGHHTNKALYSLIIAHTTRKCENTIKNFMACKSLASVEFGLWSLLQGQLGAIILKRTYISLTIGLRDL